MNVAIFLDDVNKFNGPLMFIPGSHQRGVVNAKHDVSTTSYPLWTIDKRFDPTIGAACGGQEWRHCCTQGTSSVGAGILFHSCLVHASSSNFSPWDRVSVCLSLCTVSNHIRRYKRPEYIAHRNFTPIQTLPEDLFSRGCAVDLPWKNGMPQSALQTWIEEIKLAA